jgi:transposase
MGQVLHGSARTTEAVRRAIQLREESVRAAAKRYGVSPTTVQKWRRRQSTSDARMGPKEVRSTVLTPEEEATIVAFRRHTLLPLDDCLYGLQPTIPHLTRSSLHRCLERHGISRLPETEGDKPQKKRFASYPLGYFHIDLAEVSTEEGKLRLFVAIDRTSKFAFARLVESAGKMEAAQFLRGLIAAVPYRIHTVLTDNGVRFTPRKQDVWDSRHIFDRVCGQHGIEHRLTKVNHPWTTDEVEQPYSDAAMLFFDRPQATAWRRGGHEVRARPRGLKVAPPLRRPWAPATLAGSSLRSAVGRPSRPARPGASPRAACGSGCNRRPCPADRGGPAARSGARDRAAFWRGAPAAPRRSPRRA